jgi:hypothetical protein
VHSHAKKGNQKIAEGTGRAHLTSDGHLGGGRAGAVTDALMGSELISDFFAFYRLFFL